LPIKPHDLPVMYRLTPRKNKMSKPKGQNKKVLGKSISDRPPQVLERIEFGHWGADLVKGKKIKNSSFAPLRTTFYPFTVKIS